MNVHETMNYLFHMIHEITLSFHSAQKKYPSEDLKILIKNILGILNCYVKKKIKTIALITIFFNLAHGKLESHKHIKVIAFRSVIEVFWIDFSNIMHNSGECVLLLFLECLFWWQSFCFCSFVFRGSKKLGIWVKSVGNPWLWYFFPKSFWSLFIFAN